MSALDSVVSNKDRMQLESKIAGAELAILEDTLTLNGEILTRHETNSERRISNTNLQ